MMRTTRRLHLLGSSALLMLTVLLAACGGETPATSAPAATATRAAATVSGAATTGAGAATTAATGGSAAVATATRAASAVTGAATTGAAGSAAGGTSTSAALPTTAPMPAATAAATAAATTGAAGTVTGATTGGAASPAAAGSATTAGAVRYVIGAGSEGTYTVNEKFAMLPAPNDAVGKTDQVTGQIVLGPNGQVVEGGRVVVNIQSLKSDRDMRDNYLRNTSLESSKFPEATFVIRSAEGLTGPLGAAPVNFRLTGDLTLHGVTKPVTWNATATQSGDTLNGTATLTVKMQDFNIAPPMVAILTTSDMAKLDLKIVAKRTA